MSTREIIFTFSRFENAITFGNLWKRSERNANQLKIIRRNRFSVLVF